ncbi:helix-turn-helix transcriptional regulator [Natronococcus sp. A-GB1]|uniref:helix-turn-helix transcriptional regulator n=1 Tax=Natronococcus sp. A-GB1 TaxID=3037648 RepID=UPI00241F6042|nr:helix-turn-helix transcriptional regulator [Natronococcus sp. A-GB1]MDG5758818.1 helix-turn-helix transcriptional regulator [Natronococcus sp. A-GB1]
MSKHDSSVASAFDERSSAESGSASAAGLETDEPGTTDHELDELFDQVTVALATDEVAFDESLIKENLEELLLVLVCVHGSTHGKELLADLTEAFDAQLSPGTVYPCLHELEEEGVLSMHAKVRTKEYSVVDEAYVRATLERTMTQHLAFGLLLDRFLSSYPAADSE